MCGCDKAGLPYSRNTMSPLPAGTGDDAFIENWFGQTRIRFGDTIMPVDVGGPNEMTSAFTQAD